MKTIEDINNMKTLSENYQIIARNLAEANEIQDLLLSLGKKWYWEVMTKDNKVSFTFSFDTLTFEIRGNLLDSYVDVSPEEYEHPFVTLQELRQVAAGIKTLNIFGREALIGPMGVIIGGETFTFDDINQLQEGVDSYSRDQWLNTPTGKFFKENRDDIIYNRNGAADKFMSGDIEQKIEDYINTEEGKYHESINLG